MKRFDAVGIAVAILCSSGFANAGSINAQLSRYTFELIDLDANDGITPSITFSNQSRGVSMSTAEFLGGPTVDQSHYPADGNGGAFAIGGTRSGINAFTGDYIDYQSPGWSYFFASALLGNAGYVDTRASWDADYSLSPNTRLVFRANAEASLDFDPLVGTQFGSSQVTVRFSRPGEGDTLPFYTRSVSWQDAANGTSFEEWFTLELVNDSPYALDSRFSLSTSVEWGVSAVPEPSTYLMMGSGLLLTAAALRRRRAPGAN